MCNKIPLLLSIYCLYSAKWLHFPSVNTHLHSSVFISNKTTLKLHQWLCVSTRESLQERYSETRLLSCGVCALVFLMDTTTPPPRGPAQAAPVQGCGDSVPTWGREGPSPERVRLRVPPGTGKPGVFSQTRGFCHVFWWPVYSHTAPFFPFVVGLFRIDFQGALYGLKIRLLPGIWVEDLPPPPSSTDEMPVNTQSNTHTSISGLSSLGFFVCFCLGWDHTHVNAVLLQHMHCLVLKISWLPSFKCSPS